MLTKIGFSNFAYRQTLVPGETTDLTVREGHGSGGFVVIQVHKRRQLNSSTVFSSGDILLN